MIVYRAIYGKVFEGSKVRPSVEHGVVARDDDFPAELINLLDQSHDLRCADWEEHPLRPRPAKCILFRDPYAIVVVASGIKEGPRPHDRMFTQREFFAVEGGDPAEVLAVAIARDQLTPVVDDTAPLEKVRVVPLKAELPATWTGWFREVSASLQRAGVWHVRVDPNAELDFLTQALSLQALASRQHRNRFQIWFGTEPVGVGDGPVMGIRVDDHAGLRFREPGTQRRTQWSADSNTRGARSTTHLAQPRQPQAQRPRLAPGGQPPHSAVRIERVRDRERPAPRRRMVWCTLLLVFATMAGAAAGVAIDRAWPQESPKRRRRKMNRAQATSASASVAQPVRPHTPERRPRSTATSESVPKRGGTRREVELYTQLVNLGGTDALRGWAYVEPLAEGHLSEMGLVVVMGQGRQVLLLRGRLDPMGRSAGKCALIQIDNRASKRMKEQEVSIRLTGSQLEIYWGEQKKPKFSIELIAPEVADAPTLPTAPSAAPPPASVPVASLPLVPAPTPAPISAPSAVPPAQSAQAQPTQLQTEMTPPQEEPQP